MYENIGPNLLEKKYKGSGLLFLILCLGSCPHEPFPHFKTLSLNLLKNQSPFHFFHNTLPTNICNHMDQLPVASVAPMGLDGYNLIFAVLHYCCINAQPVNPFCQNSYFLLCAFTAYFDNSEGSTINIFLNAWAVNFKNEPCAVSFPFNLLVRQMK